MVGLFALSSIKYTVSFVRIRWQLQIHTNNAAVKEDLFL